jgi:L,D-transpeptidase catalytic domain
MRPRSASALRWAATALLLAAAAWPLACVSGRRAPSSTHRTPARPTAPPSARSVTGVVAELGPAVDERLAPAFRRARLHDPPGRLYLLAFKREEKVELWASDGGAPAFVRSYPILDASGHSGPKLKEWDMQVPEGIYRIVLLNPASAYHLSMKVDYPNAYDRRRARADGRSDLGGDIYIHGGDQSIGCLAVGDRAIEDLFVLVARVGIDDVEVIIAPSDLRRRPPPKPEDSPPWVRDLYGRIAASLRPFQVR